MQDLRIRRYDELIWLKTLLCDQRCVESIVRFRARRARLQRTTTSKKTFLLPISAVDFIQDNLHSLGDRVVACSKQIMMLPVFVRLP